MKEEVYTHRGENRRHSTSHRAMWRSTRDGEESGRVRGIGGQQPLLWFLQGSQGKALGLASWKDFSRLWAAGAAPVVLVPGPGVIRAGEYWLTPVSSVKEEVWSMAPDWSGCIRKVHSGVSFAISNNWPVLGGAVSPQPARPSTPEHQQYRNIRKYS